MGEALKIFTFGHSGLDHVVCRRRIGEIESASTRIARNIAFAVVDCSLNAASVIARLSPFCFPSLFLPEREEDGRFLSLGCVFLLCAPEASFSFLSAPLVMLYFLLSGPVSSSSPTSSFSSSSFYFSLSLSSRASSSFTPPPPPSPSSPLFSFIFLHFPLCSFVFALIRLLTVWKHATVRTLSAISRLEENSIR